MGNFIILETIQTQLENWCPEGGSSSAVPGTLEMRLMMPNPRKKQTTPNWPQIGPGNWSGEIVGSCSVNFGQVVQDGPPRQAVEFTYMIMLAVLTMPTARFTWPGVIMILTPTPMKKEFPDAGHLFKADHAPSLQLSLEVTRNQFSDMLRMVEAGRLKDLHFTIEEGADGSWPVYSWGIGLRLG